MASIVDQFEFLPQNWTNDPLSPRAAGTTPHRPGGRGRAPALRRRAARVRRGPVRIRIDREVVVPTGGGYFFAPSTAALAGVLSRTP